MANAVAGLASSPDWVANIRARWEMRAAAAEEALMDAIPLAGAANAEERAADERRTGRSIPGIFDRGYVRELRRKPRVGNCDGGKTIKFNLREAGVIQPGMAKKCRIGRWRMVPG